MANGCSANYWKLNELSNSDDNGVVSKKILTARNKYGVERFSKYIKMYFYNEIKSLTDIETNLMNTYKKENKAFKMHVSFGYVTENLDDGESKIILYAPGYQYFYQCTKNYKKFYGYEKLYIGYRW
jgi:hypothetical protein